MNEALQKVNTLLKKFNNSFKISVNRVEENGETVVVGFKIDELKNDGVEFINELFETFGVIINSVSDEHELVYDDNKGLVIAKKVISVDYIIEE